MFSTHAPKAGCGLGRVNRLYNATTPDYLTVNEGDEVDVQVYVDEAKAYMCSLRGADDDTVVLKLIPAECLDLLFDIPLEEQKPQQLSSTTSTGSLHPTNAMEELVTSEERYIESLLEVRSVFFPKLRSFVNAAEAVVLFQNWSEIISVSQVSYPRCFPFYRFAHPC